MIIAAFLATILPFLPASPGTTPASPVQAQAARELNLAALEEALNKLQAAGAIGDATSWLALFQSGQMISTEELRHAFVVVASTYEPAETIEQAVVILAREKLILNPDKWKADLVEKPKVAPGVAALAIIAISKKL